MLRFHSLISKFIFMGVILLIFIGSYITASYVFIHHIKGEAQRINIAGMQRMLTMKIAGHLLLISDMPQSTERTSLIKHTKEDINLYEDMLHALRDGSKEYELKAEKDKEVVEKIDKLINIWQEIQKPFVQGLLESPDRLKAIEYYQFANTHVDRIDAVVNYIEQRHQKNIKDFDTFRIYTSGFFVAVAGFIILYLRQGIIKPALKLKDAAEKIEKGDFDVRLEVKTKDEIGNLSRTVNQMAQTLRSVFNENIKLIENLDEKVRERTKEAENAKAEAEEANKAKSDFLANMSHELRTPLNSVIGFSDLLMSGISGELTPEQKELVGYIHSSGKHLLSLINDILDLSKVESGKLELELSTFSLKDILNNSMIMLKEKAMKHGINLSLEIEPDADIEIDIEADERKLKQIMFNLLSNAVKFTPDGGSVFVKAKIDGDLIEISVSDTGIGIKQEDMGKLFQSFWQLESTLTRNYEGTGLGLALTKRLVELHGGSIRAESEYGKWSRFTFVIPIKQHTKEG